MNEINSADQKEDTQGISAEITKTSQHTLWERVAFAAQAAGTALALIFGYLAYSTSKDTVEISKETALYAKKTAELDAEYKLISIQPIISPATGAAELSLSFKNTGLGPAKIERIILQYGNFCVDSDQNPNFNRELSAYIKHILSYLAFDINLSRGYNSTVWSFAINTHLVGHFLKVDQEWNPFRLHNKLDLSGEELDRHNRQWAIFTEIDLRYKVSYNNMNGSIKTQHARSPIEPNCD